MAKNTTNLAAEMEMGLDDFALEAPKAVAKIEASQLVNKIDEKDMAGKTGFTKIEKEVIQSLDDQVDKLAEAIMTTPANSEEFRNITAALNRMGDAEITKTSNISSAMLNRRSVRSMKDNTYGGGSDIAKNLGMLRQTVVNLDPGRRDKLFTKEKWLGVKLPFGIGKKVDSYFQEYKTAEVQLNDIVKALNNGKDTLLEDNAFIDEDKEQMQELMQRLEQYAYVMKNIDKRIEEKLPQIEAEDKLKAEDIRQEILFPVRQKQMDVLQHLAVSMQGYMALQVLKRNNQELIRGVDRSSKTTIAALRTAVMVSEALGTQKLVLDQINAVNDVTNRMIDSASLQLGTQALEIQKQATESAVNVETLEKAFQNIFKAMDAMDTYRSQALPNMQKTIDSLEGSISSAKNYLSTRREERIGGFTEEVLSEVKNPEKKGAAVKIR
jgi:uncharacterized protein YaaN involved in tellurite resistance